MSTLELNIDYDEGVDSDEELNQEGEHVQVLCRVRRPLGSELQEPLAVKADAGARQVLLEDKAFTFDHVLDAECSQQQVFERIRPLVASVLEGYSGCIFAYGQTGAGKTYTMDGTEEDPGVYMRSIHELFQSVQQRGGEYAIEMSIFEIYNELIYDLLNLDTDPRLLRLAKNEEGLTIANMSRHRIQSAEEGRRLIQIGHKHRSVTSTKMNATSSRSHCVVSIRVHHKTTKACLMLIDLAGSERVKASQVAGVAMGETIAINKSLSSLALVIHALARRTTHVPWRASQLTRALAPALLGTARIAIIIALSPAAAHSSESLAALRFAVSAKAVVRPVPVAATPTLDLPAWRDAVKQLQEDLRMKQEQIAVLLKLNEQLKQENIRLTRTAVHNTEFAPRPESPVRETNSESRAHKSALRDPARSYKKKSRVIFPPYQNLETVFVTDSLCTDSDASDDEQSSLVTRKRKFEEMTASLPVTPVRHHQVKRIKVTAQPPKPLAARTPNEMNIHSNVASSPWSAGTARRVQIKHQGTPLKAQSLARTAARTRLVVSSDN